MLADHFDCTDRQRLGNQLRSAHVTSGVDSQKLEEQRREGLGLPYYRVPMKSYKDEIFERLAVVLLEGLPGRSNQVPLLCR